GAGPASPEGAGPLGVVVGAGAALLRPGLDAAGRGGRDAGERQLAELAPGVRELHAEAVQHAHVTSAMRSGGLWTWVIVGAGPTTSDAISSASAMVDAGEKPRRRTALGSPPTMTTLPRCCRAWLPQYHM